MSLFLGQVNSKFQIGSFPHMRMILIGNFDNYSEDDMITVSDRCNRKNTRRNIHLATHVARALTWENLLFEIYDIAGSKACKDFDTLCWESEEWYGQIKPFLGE